MHPTECRSVWHCAGWCVLLGGRLERRRAADVRHSQLAQRQRRPRQDEERHRAVDPALHLQDWSRIDGPGTRQGQAQAPGVTAS